MRHLRKLWGGIYCTYDFLVSRGALLFFVLPVSQAEVIATKDSCHRESKRGKITEMYPYYSRAWATDSLWIDATLWIETVAWSVNSSLVRGCDLCSLSQAQSILRSWKLLVIIQQSFCRPPLMEVISWLALRLRLCSLRGGSVRRILHSK